MIPSYLNSSSTRREQSTIIQKNLYLIFTVDARPACVFTWLWPHVLNFTNAKIARCSVQIVDFYGKWIFACLHQSLSAFAPLGLSLSSAHHLHHLVPIASLKFSLKARLQRFISHMRTCSSWCEENINKTLAPLLWFNGDVIEWLELRNF